MRNLILLACVLIAGTAIAQGYDTSTAFSDGRSLGSGAIGGGQQGIGTTNATAVVPGYGLATSQAGLFQGGMGQLSGPGVAKVLDCSSQTPDADAFRRQECEAVNFVARNPQIRPQFSITRNDPLVQGAKTASNTAAGTFASLGLRGGAGSSTQCMERTETVPAQYVTETCSALREIGDLQQCTMGRTINIDTDANFQCDATYKAMESLTCSRRANVSVTTTTSTSPCSGTKATVNGDYRDAAHASLSCTGTTGLYSVSYWSTFNNCNCSASGSVSAGGGTASIRCNNGCGWTQGVNHSVSCSGASCTWSVTFYSGNNSAGSRSAAFTGSSTSSSTSTSVSWDNSACATLAQRSQ